MIRKFSGRLDVEIFLFSHIHSTLNLIALEIKSNINVKRGFITYPIGMPTPAVSKIRASVTWTCKRHSMILTRVANLWVFCCVWPIESLKERTRLCRLLFQKEKFYGIMKVESAMTLIDNHPLFKRYWHRQLVRCQVTNANVFFNRKNVVLAFLNVNFIVKYCLFSERDGKSVWESERREGVQIRNINETCTRSLVKFAFIWLSISIYAESHHKEFILRR